MSGLGCGIKKAYCLDSASMVSLLLSATACGGSKGDAAGGGETTTPAKDATGTPIVTAKGQKVSEKGHDKWQEAVQLFNRYEKEGWTKKHCSEAAKRFEKAADAEGGNFAEAIYMVGASKERCEGAAAAKSDYEKALGLNPKLCEPRVGLGMMHMDAGRTAQAESEFRRALQNDPQCTEAYVNLAVIEGSKGGNQLQDALNNLRRALAIQSEYLPAFNEMALLYLKQAERESNVERLDLAEIVCRQAQLLNDSYAPIYNTWGLVKMRKGAIIEALRFFERASKLDKDLFEAHMNFGEVTLSFRGYDDAKQALVRATQLRPKNYEAHLALGTAYRGLKQYNQAQKEFELAMKLDGARPEAYYNLGILHQDYMSGSVAEFEKARQYFQQFLAKAGGQARYAAAVADVKQTCQAEVKRKGKKKTRIVRSSDCRPGRLQNIATAIGAMREAEKIQGQAKGGKK